MSGNILRKAHKNQFIVLIFFWLCVSPTPSYGQKAIGFDARQLSPSSTKFSLVVAGASTLKAYMSAGHLILRAQDSKIDFSFDWGVFDQSKKDFFVDYVFGRLDYQHIVRPFSETVSIYRSEKRALIEYPLNLSKQQKQQLIIELRNWAKPQNSTYRYDIVFNNCSTVIGSLIASIAGPATEKYLDAASTETIRNAGLPYLGHFPLIQIFADLIGGPKSDQKIQLKDLFYLPILVPDLLIQANRDLLASKEILVSGDNTPPSSASWTTVMGIVFILCYLLITFLFFRKKINRLGLAALIFPASIISSSIGTIIVFLSYFSLHSFAWENLGIAFFWPVDVICIVLIFKSKKWLRIYSGLHIFVAIFAILLNISPALPTQSLFAASLISLPFWSLLFTVGSMRPSNGLT